KSAEGLDQIRMSRDTSKRFLDSLKLTDGHAKLFADRRVCTHSACNQLCATNTLCGERNSAACSQAFHQHLPTAAGAVDSANNRVNRDNHVFALSGAVVKRHAKRIVAAANDHSRSICRDKPASNTDVFTFAQKIFGVLQAESESKHR